MSEPANLLRYRAAGDLLFINRRLVDLEAEGPRDSTITLGQALAAVQEKDSQPSTATPGVAVDPVDPS